ncbi:FAD-dependent monooxygenase [uncultured Jatrophihabitans sp.]|uniref:FAD-dependent monooxygenase n=1 Tax=uncultured Jatrophihabitans sp. TaxID=1610747 RepID=UPI0035CC2C4F
MRVLVVGAGIGGLGAAIALTQHGYDVDVVEVKPEFSVYGVGINQPANSLRALRSLGVLDRCLAVGYQFDQCDFYGADGEHLVNIPYGFSGEDVPCNNALSRLDLHRILLERAEDVGIKVRYHTSVADLADRGDEVEVELTDGRHETYDLVVAFDGIKSWTRRKIFGDQFDPVHSGFGVLRITLPRPAEVTGMRVYQALGVKLGFCPLSEESMYMFVVTPQPSNVVHDPATLGDLLRSQLEPFGDLPGRVRDSISGPAGIVYSPISDVMLPLPWFSGRVGVLGDAAHACAPHLTQGAGMALEDGVVLAEMLAETLTGGGPIEQILRQFGERRFPRAKLVQDVSHQILANEMAINADNYAASVEAMRTHLPDQSRAVDRLLDAPA